jgi:hypothetical protein
MRLVPRLLPLIMSIACNASDHSAWDVLLKEFVGPDHLVDYTRLKASGLVRLDAYLSALAPPWPAEWTPAHRKAASINAYNALTMRWVAAHYPIESIWRTKRPFREQRHKLDGRSVSLEDIETELRNTGDVRIHAALVCAARSCPPLRREAYVPHWLESQLEENTRAWLENPKLNSFDPATGRAEISKIFDWYKGDFAKTGGVAVFLARYGIAAKRISHKSYAWGLNDVAGRGSSYSGLAFYRDYLWNK